MATSKGSNSRFIKLKKISSGGRFFSTPLALALGAGSTALLGGIPPAAYAQVTTAALEGTAADPTGAAIPHAGVTLRNEASGTTRTTTSNGVGLFNFSAVPTGTYTITIVAPGFDTLNQKGVHLDPEDHRQLGLLKLAPGREDTTVTVESSSTTTPVQQSEVSNLISAQDIEKLSVEGRDVTELEKILPGFAIAQNSAGITNSAFDPSQVSITGALGSYAANGSPTNGVALLSDGANLTDPGSYGAATQNVNYDFTEEVKVQTSNFGADVANGPIVINAVGKAGGDHFHGSLYAYGRSGKFNSVDPLAASFGKPPSHETYLGGTLGGPLRIPGTDFNHSNKATFFIGGEDYVQRSEYAYGSASSAIYRALVPTANMRAGNFTQPELMTYLGNEFTNSSYANLAAVPSFAKDGTAIQGQIPSAQLDSGSAAIFGSLPLPNQTSANGYNFTGQDLINNDLYQVRGRTDIAINKNNRFFAVYNVERGSQGNPQSLYFAPSTEAVPLGGVNTPGGLIQNINSQTASADLTTILGTSRTNELFGDLTYLDDAFTSGNINALEAAYPYHGIYNNGTKALPQLSDYGYDGLPLEQSPDVSLGPIYAHKFTPSFGDNFTQVIRTHTLKIGTFVQRVENNQVQPNIGGSCVACTNGQIGLYYYPAAGGTFAQATGTTPTFTTSGNYLANFAEGAVQQYTQINELPAQDLYFWNIDGYVTDQWKLTKRLQLDLGVRFEHLGQWNDAHHLGAAVFDPTQLNNAALSVPGFQWNGIDSSVSNGGNPTRAAFIEPRGGFALDLYGNGKTVLRGGFGEYRAHDNWNDISPAFATSQGVRSSTVGTNPDITLSDINALDNLPPTTKGGLSSTVAGLPGNDDEEPLVSTYSFGVSQALGKSVLLISYVGNNSDHLLADDSNGPADAGNLENINYIPIGGLYKPNPVTGVVTPLSQLELIGTAAINQYRPYPQYSEIDIPRHILSANYNGLQVDWEKRTGKLNFGINYTWSRSLGYRGGYYNGNAIDPTNLRNNYGILSYDRTNVFNSSYSYDFGKVTERHYLRQIANGWRLSGVTTVQSGPDLSSISGTAGFSTTIITGVGSGASTTETNLTRLGTPDVVIVPNITCNPAAHTAARQYVNAACFQLPQVGTNGPSQYPYIHGPGFLDTDITATKDFRFGEHQSVQVRAAGFNFINHPLDTFVGGATAATLTFNSPSTNPQTVASTANVGQGFGVVTQETGRRVLEFSVKYNF